MMWLSSLLWYHLINYLPSHCLQPLTHSHVTTLSTTFDSSHTPMSQPSPHCHCHHHPHTPPYSPHIPTSTLLTHSPFPYNLPHTFQSCLLEHRQEPVPQTRLTYTHGKKMQKKKNKSIDQLDKYQSCRGRLFIVSLCRKEACVVSDVMWLV